MPDFDKNLKPKLENPDPTLPRLDNPIVPGMDAYGQSLSRKDGDIFDQVFGPYKSGLAPTVSFQELYDNRRYSRYDPTVEDLEDQKAYAQTFSEKAANGLLKGLNLTATTVAGGFGMLGGLIASPFTGRLATIWDNPVMRGLDEYNNEVDQVYLPNYYTNVEKDAKWYSTDNWLKTNFLFDKLIKNSGYAVGAMVSGNIANAALKGAGALVGSLAMRAAQAEEAAQGFKLFTPLLRNMSRGFSNAKNVEVAATLEKGIDSLAALDATSSEIANIARTTSQISNIANESIIGRRAIIAAYSSAGESAWEALGTGNEYRQTLIDRYKLEHGGEEPTGVALQNINSEVDKVGKASFFANLALLSATEYTQLGKLLGSSYSAERRAANALLGETEDVVLREGKYVAASSLEKSSKFGRLARTIPGVGRYIFDPKESFQELGQMAVQVGSQNYYDKASQSDAADVLLDGVLFGFLDEKKGALYTKEGGESLILGGLTGGLMQARSNYMESRNKKANTSAYINSLQLAPTAREAFKARKDAANRGVVLQQEHEEAVKEGNKLEAMDKKSDIAFNYIFPRIKYGRTDMIMEDLQDIRADLYSNNGLAKVKEQGLASINDTVQDVEKRLATFEKSVKDAADIYNSLVMRYGGALDENGQRVYANDVIEKMAYSAYKITDYDNRLMALGQELTSKNINPIKAREAIANSKAWKEGSARDVVEEPEIKEALLDVRSQIDGVKGATDDVLEDTKLLFADYVDLALRRKKFLEEYNGMKAAPQQYQQRKEDYTEKEKTPEEQIDEKRKAEMTPAEQAREEKFIGFKTRTGEKKLYYNTPYLVGKHVDYDDRGNEVYSPLELIILGENEDGTIKIKTNNDIILDIDKSALERYNVSRLDIIEQSTAANYYHKFANKVFTFNFGEKAGGKKKGRISYNASKDSLYFIYKDDKGKIKQRKLSREDWEAQKGYDQARLEVIGELTGSTFDEQKAKEAFLSQTEIEAEKKRRALEQEKDARMQVIADVTNQTKERIDEVNKKIVDKESELKDIVNKIDELREQKVPEARGKRERRLEEKYPELTRQAKKFKKVFSETSRAILKLTRLKEDVEYEIASLRADANNLAINLEYLETLYNSLEERPESTKEFLQELKDEMEWTGMVSKEALSDISTLTKLAKEIDDTIKSLAKFLKQSMQKFNKDYPDYYKDALDRMIEQGGIISQIDQVIKYKDELQFLADIEKEISVKNEDIEQITQQINGLLATIEQISRQSDIKEKLIKKFQEMVNNWEEAARKEEQMMQDKEFQDKLFNSQRQVDEETYDDSFEPLTEEQIEEEEKKQENFSPAKDIRIAFASPIVSPGSTRPSDIRYNFFLQNFYKIPAEKRNRMRRIFVAKGNQRALGLAELSQNNEEFGIIEEHLDYVKTFKPSTEDDKLIISLYVMYDEDGQTLHYVDRFGEKAGKVGDYIEDRSKLVWASMPRPTEKTGKYDRFFQKDKNMIESYINGYKAWRAKVLSQTTTILPPQPFFISRGVTKKGSGKNYIVGSIVSKQELADGKPVVVISTTGEIVHNGVNVTVPKGRPYIQNGNILEPVYNRNFTEKEVDTLFDVLIEFVKRANANRGTWDPILTKYLQGITFFRSPYSKPKEGEERTKGPVFRNQFYFDNGTFYFGENEIPVKFSEEDLRVNETLVKNFFKGAYNNININFVKKNEPYTEMVRDENGKLQEKQWRSYQEYLISNEGRSRLEVPLSTQVVSPSNDIPNDSIFKFGSLYTYVQEMFQVDLTPDNAEPIQPAPTPAPKPAEKARPAFLDRLVRTMTPEKKQAATAGDVNAQREWMIEEISEFYDALRNNDVDEIGEETIGLYRTAQQFPDVQNEIAPYIDDIIKALNSFDYKEQFGKWKAKKESKNQAKDVTEQSLKTFIDGINNKYKGVTDDRILTDEQIEEEVRKMGRDPKLPSGMLFVNKLKEDRERIIEKRKKQEGIQPEKPGAAPAGKTSIEDMIKQGLQSEDDDVPWERVNTIDLPGPEPVKSDEPITPIKKEENDPEKPEGYDDQEYRVVGAYSYAMADVEKEVEYIKKNSPFPVTVIDNLIAAGNGLFAWGSYKKGAITLSRLMEEGTGYHEYFHGIFDVFLNGKEKTRIYKEFQSRDGVFFDRLTGKELDYKDATAAQIRDRLAEEFRDKKMYDINPPKPAKTNFILKFFQDLIKFIESIFTGNIRNLDNLFARMDSGYYKNAPFRSVPSEEIEYKVRTLGTLDSADTSSVVKFVVGRIVKRLMTSGKASIINDLDFKREIDINEVYETVKRDLKYYYNTDLRNKLIRESGFTDEMYETQFGPVRDAIFANWDQLKAFTGEVFRTYKILQVLSSERYESDEFSGRNEDSYLVKEFSYDSKKNAPASIKLLISSLTEAIYNSFEGGEMQISDINKRSKVVVPLKDQSTQLHRSVDYAKTFNYLLSKLTTATTLKEKEEVLKQLKETNATYKPLYDMLKMDTNDLTAAEWDLKIKFDNTFSKDRPVALITYIQADGSVTIGEANQKDTRNILANNWLGEIKTTRLVKIQNSKYTLKAQSLAKKPATSAGEVFDFLSSFGILFNNDQRGNVTTEQLDNLRRAIVSIKSQIANDLTATTLDTLGLKGPLDKIFQVYLETQNLDPEAVILNIKQQPVQQFIQTSSVGRIIKDINNAKSKQDLIQKLPFLNGSFSEDSVFLNDKFFPATPKEGPRVTMKYVMGTIDRTNNKSTETADLSIGDRYLQSFNQNLAGNYYLLMPGDSQTEKIVSMPNLYDGLTPDALKQLWKYYQKEQSLDGKSKKRVFNFIGDDVTSEEKFNDAMREFVSYEVQKAMDLLIDSGIIEKYSENFYSWKNLYKDYIEDKKVGIKTGKLTEAQIKEIIEYRTVNYIANNIEITKLFFGDPAAYDEPLRRFKSFMSPYEQALYDSPEYNAFANQYFNLVNGNIRLKPGDPGYMWFSDVMKTYTVSDVFSSISSLPGYENINTTDGQAIATLSAFRQMMKKVGARWTEAHETQFQYEMAKDRLMMSKDGLFSYQGRENLQSHDQALVDKGDPLAASFSPIKPLVAGFDGATPILDKYSIYPLTYNVVKDKGEALGKQYARMLNNGVSYIIMDSGRKVGVDEFDSIYNEDGSVKDEKTPYNKKAEVGVNFKWFGIQVETQDAKDEQTEGSQLAKLATINLLSNGVPEGYEGTKADWEELSYEERIKQSDVYRLVEKEKELKRTMIREGFRTLLDKFGYSDTTGKVSNKKILDLILDQATRRGLNDNLRSALQIKEGTDEFLVPLEALNNYEEIKSILFSYIDRYIASPKLNGGPKVQVSGAGWDIDGKRVKVKNFTDKNGRKRTLYTHAGLKFYTKDDPYMEVYLPHWFGEKLRRAGINLDDVKIEDIDPEVLKGIGFRIPTQELNSVEAFRVKGFLPESMGSMIVVPEAITKKAGSDFDIDKLSTYLKNVFIDREGKVRLVPFVNSLEEAKKVFGAMFDEKLSRSRKVTEKKIDFQARLLEALQTISEGLPENNRIASFIQKKSALIEKLYESANTTEEEREIQQQVIDSILDLDSKRKELNDENLQAEFRNKEINRMYKQSLENEYFKTLEEIITHPKNFERLTTPNTSKEMEDIAKELEAINEEEFGEGKYKTIISPSHMNTMRHYFLVGKLGIGVGAVSQTNTALAQKSDIYIDPERISNLQDATEKMYIKDASVKLPSNKTTIGGKVYATISSIRDVAERFISDKISQYINGFVDAGKNPFLMKIGVTRANSGTFLLLERLGVPSNVTVYFMNQPIIKEYNRLLSKNKKSYPFNPKLIKQARAMFPTNEKISDFPTQNVDYLAAILKDSIMKYYQQGEKKFSNKDAAMQQFILEEYLKYTALASNLFRFTQATNYDTANVYSPWLLEQKKIKTAQARTDNVFSSVDKILDNTFLGDMMDGIVTSGDIISEAFVFLNAKQKQVLKPFVQELADRFMSAQNYMRAARKLEHSFINFLSQTNGQYNKEIQSLAIDSATSVVRMLKELQTNIANGKLDSKLAYNPILVRLTSDNTEEPGDTKVIRMIDKSRDIFSENMYTEALQELRANPATTELYGNLIRLGFIQSGIGTSPISFLDIVPVDDYKQFIMPAIDALKNPALLESFINVGSFQRNNWNDSNCVDTIEEKLEEDEMGFTGEVLNRYNNPLLNEYVKSKKIDNFYAYTVQSTNSKAKNKYLTVRVGTGINRKTVLLRRVDSTTSVGKPFYTPPDEYGRQYTVYASINPWGDGVYGQEHYTMPRRSVYNNGAMRMNAELSNEELYKVLMGELKAMPTEVVAAVEAPTMPVLTTTGAPVTKIVSGGQTGVDRIGLEVGKELGFQTGGTVAPGFYTEIGKDDSLKNFGVEEISDELQAGKTGREFYLPRTEQNVLNSDGTVYFATDKDSAGKVATEKFAKQHGRPFILNPTADKLNQWLIDNNIRTLNVAGNRGSALSNQQLDNIKNILREALGNPVVPKAMPFPGEREFTPEKLTKANMPANGIFVFGSNDRGAHGLGAAKVAVEDFGATVGKAKGRQGNSFAIRTKMYQANVLTEYGDLIKDNKKIMDRMTVEDLNDLRTEALVNPTLKYYVTQIGTGLAGRSIDEMKDMFRRMNDKLGIPENIILPRAFEVRDETKPGMSTNEKMKMSNDEIRKTKEYQEWRATQTLPPSDFDEDDLIDYYKECIG